MSSNGAIPLDDNNKPITAGYDATGHQIVAAEIVSVTTDSTTGVKHGALNVNATFSASSLAINDPTITTQKMGVNAQGQITSQIADSAGTNIAGVDSSHNLLTKVNAALPAGTNVIGHVIADSGSTTAVTQATAANLNATATIQAVTGTALAADQTNSELRVSLYGKNSAAGDTALKVASSGDMIIEGAGTAGTATGGVVTVQGVASMTALTVAQTTGSNLHTVLDSGSTTAVTQATGSNLHAVLDSGSTTAVTQATGSNLHAVLDSGSTTAVTQATAANLNATATIQAVTGTSLAADVSNTELRVSNYVKTSAAGDTALTLGQAAMAGSLPVTIANNQGAIGSVVVQAVAGTALVADQTNSELRVSLYGKNSAAGDTPVLVDSTGRVLVGRSTTAVYTLASTTTSGTTQNSGDLTVGPYTEAAIDITTTAQAGTNPTIQYIYERKGADGLYYPLWQSAVLTSAANTISTSIGVGMAYNQSLGLTGRLRWVVGGTATPTFTHSINLYCK